MISQLPSRRGRHRVFVNLNTDASGEATRTRTTTRSIRGRVDGIRNYFVFQVVQRSIRRVRT